jgi:hypothetical protein
MSETDRETEVKRERETDRAKFSPSSLIDLSRDELALVFDLVVDVVLGVGHDALVLDPSHGRGDQDRAQVWILTTKIFKVPTSIGDTSDADARTKLNVCTFLFELCGHSGVPSVHQIHIPSGSHRKTRRPGSC